MQVVRFGSTAPGTHQKQACCASKTDTAVAPSMGNHLITRTLRYWLGTQAVYLLYHASDNMAHPPSRTNIPSDFFSEPSGGGGGGGANEKDSFGKDLSSTPFHRRMRRFGARMRSFPLSGKPASKAVLAGGSVIIYHTRYTAELVPRRKGVQEVSRF